MSIDSHATAFAATQFTQSEAFAALPPYAEIQAAYHQAHADDLRAMIAALPLQADSRVLDLACGAGTYTRWLAERIGPEGQVIGIDIDPAFLKAAQEHLSSSRIAERVVFQQGDSSGLPFAEHYFDVVWCAQSMYSLPDPLAALQELHRVVRPGGTVAVFENDVIHQVGLPWPADLELAVRQAQLQAFQHGNLFPERFFLARSFCEVFREAGFMDCSITPYTSVRHAPLAAAERTFLVGYLADLDQRTSSFLEADQRERLTALIDPASPAYLLDDPDFFVTYIDILACGTKAA